MSLDGIDFSDPRVIERIGRLDPAHKQDVLRLLEERERLAKLELCRTDFLTFVKAVWPDFIPGAHHTLMAEQFNRVAQGKLKRLIINMPPRMGKSQLASWLLPSWFLGLFPKKQIIQASNNERLAAGFGRKVRNLVGREDSGMVDFLGPDRYHEIFPHTTLATDSKAAGLWHTNQGGVYFAAGVDSNVAGMGADIFIIDDPHSEREAKQAANRPEIFDDVYEWYTSGPRQRLQPNGVIIIVATRWSKRDLTGQVLRQMEDDIRSGKRPGTFDDWEVLELPAIINEHTVNERSMWPGFWTLEALQATRTAMPPGKWLAQYQQNPTASEGAILKKERWKRWTRDEPPPCKYVIQSWDTANTKTNRADFSAMTLWGVFETEDPNTHDRVDNLILLNAFKARMEFPELKIRVKQFYVDDQPDTLLIENKGSGMSLIQEFRAMNLPVEDYSYGRGIRRGDNDKIARANAVSDLFASGYVWAPERRFAEEVIEECAEFPNGEHDDYVDSVVQALLRLRTGGLVATANDDRDDRNERAPYVRKRMY